METRDPPNNVWCMTHPLQKKSLSQNVHGAERALDALFSSPSSELSHHGACRDPSRDIGFRAWEKTGSQKTRSNGQGSKVPLSQPWAETGWVAVAKARSQIWEQGPRGQGQQETPRSGDSLRRWVGAPAGLCY